MLKLKPEEMKFTKEQDLHLLQEALNVEPFSRGKGLGWKMITNKLIKLDQFPVTLKPKIVRERILKLMDGDASLSTNDSGDANVNSKEMDGYIKRLIDLREEAMKLVKHLVTNDTDKDTEMEESVDPMTGPETPQSHSSGKETRHQGVQGKQPSAEKKSPVKRAYQRQPKTSSPPNYLKFLEDREAKRLKIREEELALRKEELEERKRLVKVLEERFEEEKKIREQLFELLKK